MNVSSNPSWSAPEQFDPMTGVAEHDFASFLDLGDIDLDFPNFDQNAASSAAPEGDQQLKELADPLDMQHLPPSTSIGPFDHMKLSQHQQHQQGLIQPTTMQEQSNAFLSYNMPQFNHMAQAQPQFDAASANVYHQNFRGIPPTPNSVEIHGDPSRYLRQLDTQSHGMMDQAQYQVRKDDVASFTPLVSPAVTPHDSQYPVPSNYTTTPGAYLSPLTSPALKGQVHPGAQFSQTPSQASGSSAPSPDDGDIEMAGDGTPPTAESLRKGKGKKPATPRSSGPAPKVRQSPIVKPQRRKVNRLSTVIPSKDVSDILEGVRQMSADYSRPQSARLSTHLQGREGSESDSISPEPLTESVMGPPPRPNSVSHSPMIAARGGNNSAQGMPATPASLMRLQQSPNVAAHGMSPSMQANTPSGRQQSSAPPMLEELTLPEAADTSRPSVSRTESTYSDDAATPRIPARKTPKLAPVSSPSAAIASSGRSPAIGPLTSPIVATSPVNGKRPDQRGGRNTKKRNTTSSALISPALRPKISPSIKPLLPDGAFSDEKHALLLATKSNYQNILEGTHVPGVTYPEALTTNLTSKRTSHKIAEQGRRNRINTALQEMQSLLPSPTVSAKTPKLQPSADGQNSDSKSANEGGSDGTAGKASTQGSSKAATVEQAIEFIKLLKKEAGEREKVIESKDKEVEELRKRLNELEKKFASSSRRASLCSDDKIPEEGESESEHKSNREETDQAMEVESNT